MTQIIIQSQLPFEQLIQTIEQLDSSELEQLIAQTIKVKTKRKILSLPNDQSLLLQQITQCIPDQLQDRYNFLISKRQDNTITDQEYQELINLGEHIEAIDVKRLENLTELAKLRQTSLKELIKEFQLQPQAL